jgi:hypothetical protein
MKRYPFLSTILIAFLLVTAVACTPMLESGDVYRRSTAQERIILEDPYYTGAPYVYRDQRTGQLYEVRPGRYTAYGYDRYDRRYDSRYYNRNNDRYYRQTPSRGSSMTPAERKAGEEKNKSARDKIFGTGS